MHPQATPGWLPMDDGIALRTHAWPHTAAGPSRGTVLIVHGLADDNVVFDHSARAIAAYQKAGNPFETMVYPGQTHRINDPVLQQHLWATILNFLDREVKAKGR